MGIEIIKGNEKSTIKITDSSLSGNSVEYLKLEALKLIENGFKHIVLDLSITNYIDSSGIGKILFINKKITSIGGLLEISDITPTLLDFFETLAMDKIIPIAKK